MRSLYNIRVVCFRSHFRAFQRKIGLVDILDTKDPLEDDTCEGLKKRISSTFRFGPILNHDWVMSGKLSQVSLGPKSAFFFGALSSISNPASSSGFGKGLAIISS